jgi:flagellar hook-length control protein FliK
VNSPNDSFRNVGKAGGFMSEMNSIRSLASQDTTHVRRRSYNVISNQNSFEEELLKLQFFDTQVEASPLHPIEPATKAEKNKEPEPESETDESNETTESSDEYVYGVVAPQLPIPAETSIEDLAASDSDVTQELEVDALNGDLPQSIEETKVIAGNPASLQEPVVEEAGPAIVDPEGAGFVQEIASDSLRDPTNEKEQVKPSDIPAATPVTSDTQSVQFESDTSTQKVSSAASKKQTKDSKPDVESEFVLKKEDLDSREKPVLDASNQESRPVEEAVAFPSMDSQTSESEPQENRRSERLERNRLDSGNSFDDAYREPSVDVGLENQSSVEASFEPTNLSDIPPEPTTFSNAPPISDSIVVSAPQSNLTPNPASLSIAAGIVPNATLNSNPSTPSSSGAVSVTNNISGSTSTSASRETTGSSRANLTPYQESKLVQRVLRGIEQLGNGGGQVRIRLHPPELGTLQMTLKFEATQVTAQFEVENRVARDALLGNSQVLKDRLKEQGLEVQKFEVEVRSDVNDSLNSSTGDRQGQRNSSSDRNFESRFAVANNNRINPEARPEPSNTTMPWVRTKGSLDVSA